MIKYISFLVVSLLGGYFYAIGFPNASGQNYYFAPLLGFVLFALALNNSFKKREALFIALCFSIGFGAFGYYWISHLLKEFGGFQPPANYIGSIFFDVIVAPQTYVFAFIFSILKKKNFSIGHHFGPIGLAFIYTLCEVFIPQQFPAHLGHALLNLKSFGGLDLAPIFGASFYSFLSFWLALEIARLFSYRRINISLILIPILFVIDFNYSDSNNSQNNLKNFTVRFVQPNIGNYLKLSSEGGGFNSQREVLDTFYGLSRIEEKTKLDLIVWPETAWPLSQNSKEMRQGMGIHSSFKAILEKTNADLFIGGYDLNSQNFSNFENEYNSAFLFKNDQTFSNVYHKMKLIPFGETLPFGPLNEKLAEVVKEVSFFAKGEDYTFFEMTNGTKFISAICYEILFSDFLRDYLNSKNESAHFIVNLTNDSWYGETAEPWQHLFLTRWRALEFNMPIIRSTNTGISTVILADGSFNEYLGVNQKNILDTTFKLPEIPNESTVFQKLGLIPLTLLFGLLSFVHFIVHFLETKFLKPKIHKKNINIEE